MVGTELVVRVRTGSRLHFGLLAWGDQGPRRFGGVGLMVQRPGNEVAVGLLDPTAGSTVTSGASKRAADYARCFLDSLSTAERQAVPPNVSVRVVKAAAEHVGLGTGTQVALAVARALAVWAKRSQMSAVELARRVGRGRRSAVGLHGFERGGFLVEAGKRAEDEISPLIARVDFPVQWHFVLITPRDWYGLHGQREQEAFDRLPPPSEELTGRLCRLALLGLLPAVMEQDFAAFSQALYAFGRQVGQCFAPVQGGVYSSPSAEQIINALARHGLRGVAQSSWGPTLCAVAKSRLQAEWVAARLRDTFPADRADIITTPADNRGARVELVEG